jgi:4-amino-4-deoxy-L-arabinose transferase-like glycosyltransferase
LADGQAIYVAPNITFVSFLYTPLYFYVSAAASAILGVGFFSLRLVSFIASLISFILIFLIVRDETKNAWVAFLSMCLFAATYSLTGAWMDIARVDSLFLTLWLSFIYVVRRKKSTGYAVCAGLCAAMAFLTKQTALLTCLPVILYLFGHSWRYGLSLILVVTLVVGVTTVMLNQASAGWYTYYVFQLQFQQTEWMPLAMVSFWKDDLLAHLPMNILFVMFFFIGRPHRSRFRLNLWLSILVGALAGTFLTRVKVGGYDNVLLPAYAVICILFGLGLNAAFEAADQLLVEHRGRIALLIQVACLTQLVILYYNPYAQIPTRADLNAGYEIVNLISQLKGNVFLPDHGYLAMLAGKTSYAHHSAMWDVLREDRQTVGKALLRNDLHNAISGEVFDVIVLDPDWNYCCREINKYYTKAGELFQDESVFYPVTGWKRRSTYIYIANRLQGSELDYLHEQDPD